jgi:ABC-type bacteriocin/lantibiotic exporter with double-glycine peptidase domain
MADFNNYRGILMPDKNNMRQILIFLRPYIKEEILLLLLFFVNSGLIIFAPILIGVLFDKGIVNRNISLIINYSLIILFIYVIRKCFEYLQGVLFGYVDQNIMRDLRSKLYMKKMTLPIDYFKKNKPGEIISIFVDDVNTLSGLLSTLFVNGLSNIILVLSVAIILVFKSMILGIVSIAILIVFVISFKFFNKDFSNTGKKLRQNSSNFKSKIEESIFHYKSIKSLSTQNIEINNFNDFISGCFKDSINLINLSSISNATIGFISMLGPLLILYLGAMQIIDGSLTVGGLIAINTLLAQLYTPVVSLAQINFNFHSAKESITRIIGFLNEKEEENIGNIEFSGLNNKIEFKNATFAYTNGKKILNNLSFIVPKGVIALLSGDSGAGKSTIVDLLCRFLSLQEGVILFDNINIKDFEITSYRNNLAVMNQDDFIFKKTLKENITYGNALSTLADVYYITQSVKLDALIDEPNKLDLTVGEKGSTLSGGQKRKITFARSLLKSNSNILILDEPSNGLDSESKQAVIESIKSLKGCKTIIISSHDNDFKQIADIIINI